MIKLYATLARITKAAHTHTNMSLRYSPWCVV